MKNITVELLEKFAVDFANKIDNLFVRKTRKINGKSLSADITLSAEDIEAIPSSEKGSANGVAELDATGKVPAAQLPSFVDDVIEGYFNNNNFYKESTYATLIPGESGKIYIDLTTNKTYRWSGSTYVPISDTIALGETATTAYRGDRGKIAYEHSLTQHAPSNAEPNVQSDWSVSDSASDAYIKNKPTALPANGGDAETVNGHTVGTDVPINAKFTDTTYGLASASEDGLMSKEDKAKLGEMEEATTTDIDNIIAGIFA